MNENLSNQEIKLQYFIDYWEYFTAIKEDERTKLSHFKSLEQYSINPILYNPKELFKEFIDEIERKNLSNSNNKKFFIENVNNLIDLKLETLKFLESTLKIIQQQSSKKDDLLSALKSTLKEMSDFRLGKECVKELSKILFNDKELESNDKESIKHLVRFIVFELQHKGFSDKVIHEIKDGKVKVIEIFNDYFDSETLSVKFIFQVTGLIHNKNLKMGGVEIYNPFVKQFISKSEDDFNRKKEFFGRLDEEISLDSGLEKNKEESPTFCNIAIDIEMINDTENIEYEAYKAIKKANLFFDVIASRYSELDSNIKVDKDYFIIVDNKGNFFGSKKHFEQYIPIILSNSIDMKSFNHPKEYQDYYAKLIENQSLNLLDTKISESLTWKRRALETESENYAILSNWICLENLFEIKGENTIKNILNVAPKILAIVYKNQYSIDEGCVILYNYWKSRKCNLSDRGKKIIDGINDKECKIKRKDVLKKMIEFTEVESNNFKHNFYFDRLQELINYHKDCKLIEKYEDNQRQKLIFLYRLRNKIAHNANNKYSPIITYYKNFANYANNLFVSYFIDKRM